MMDREGDGSSRREVLEFLDVEISQLHARIKASGWPRWGIALASGGIAWALLKLMISGRWSLAGSAEAVLFGAGAWRVLVAIRDRVESLGTRSSDSRRFRWTLGLLEGPRLWLVLRIAVATGLLALVLVVWSRTAWIGRIVPMALAVEELLGVFIVIWLIQSRRDFPVFSGMGAAAPFKAAALANVLLGGSLAWAFWKPAVHGHAVDQQAGALILVLAYLLLRYADQLTGSPLVGALEEIRHELMLRRVAPAHAMRQAESIIDGLPLEGLFGKELAEVVAREQDWQTASQAVRRALSSIHEAIEQSVESTAVKESMEDLRQSKARLDAVRAELDRARLVLQGRHEMASRLLPAFGMVLPASVTLPVIDGLVGDGEELDLGLATLRCEMDARGLITPDADRKAQ